MTTYKLKEPWEGFLSANKLSPGADEDTLLKLLYILWDNSDTLSVPPEINLPELMELSPESIIY